jgi:flagella basal body P-ring formation protein FlgA
LTARLSPAPNIVRAGSAVKLLIDGKNMRITVPVVCLQSGRQGQTIRVASSDRKRVYQAQVISQEFVRNTL